MADRVSPLIDGLDGMVDMLADLAAGSVRHIKREQGDRPAGSVPLTDEEFARRVVPAWQTYAGGAPPLAQRYFGDRVAELGPVEALREDRDARRLYKQYPHYAAVYRTPEQHKEYEMQRGLGLHPGTIPKTAKEMRGG